MQKLLALKIHEFFLCLLIMLVELDLVVLLKILTSLYKLKLVMRY